MLPLPRGLVRIFGWILRDFKGEAAKNDLLPSTLFAVEAGDADDIAGILEMVGDGGVDMAVAAGRVFPHLADGVTGAVLVVEGLDAAVLESLGAIYLDLDMGDNVAVVRDTEKHVEGSVGQLGEGIVARSGLAVVGQQRPAGDSGSHCWQRRQSEASNLSQRYPERVSGHDETGGPAAEHVEQRFQQLLDLDVDTTSSMLWVPRKTTMVETKPSAFSAYPTNPCMSVDALETTPAILKDDRSASQQREQFHAARL